jgi:hypothetical protein
MIFGNFTVHTVSRSWIQATVEVARIALVGKDDLKMKIYMTCMSMIQCVVVQTIQTPVIVYAV